MHFEAQAKVMSANHKSLTMRAAKDKVYAMPGKSHTHAERLEAAITF